MEGRRKDVINWLTENGHPDIPVSTMTLYREMGLLDDCIIEPPKGNSRKTSTIYDVEKAGKRIIWIKEKQRVERLTLEEIKELIKQGKADN